VTIKYYITCRLACLWYPNNSSVGKCY